MTRLAARLVGVGRATTDVDSAASVGPPGGVDEFSLRHTHQHSSLVSTALHLTGVERQDDT